MRKLFFLFTFCAGILTAQSQTFTSGLTTTGTGATANTRLGGTSALLANTNLELGTFNFNLNNGKVGIGVATPLSLLHIKAGTATVAPLIFTTGINLTTPVAGGIEYDGTNLTFTPTTVLGRKTILFSDLSNLSGVIPIAKGGTGASTLATGYVKSNGTVLSTVSTVLGAEVSGNITGNAANVTGIVSVANGGTGATTNTGVLIGNGTTATTAVGTTVGLQYLRRNSGNTGYEFGALPAGGAGTVTSIGLTVPGGLIVAPATITTSGTFAITTALNGLLRANGTGFTTGQANLATEVTGVLSNVNGGTGQSTYAIGDLLYASAVNTLTKRTIGTANQVLTMVSGVPTWATLPAGTGGTLGGEVTGAQTATVVGNAAVIGKVLTGYASASGTVAATDNILQAIGKLNGNDALKVVANAGITAATNTKITYDAKGLVLAGTSLASADIPNNASNTTGNAATATTATNIAGGAAGNIPYQTGAGATGMIPLGTSGYVLTSGGAGAPTWTDATILPNTAWGLNGNANATTSSFLGTPTLTDVDLIFKRNGVISGRLNDAFFNTSFGVNSQQAITGVGGSPVAAKKYNSSFGYGALQNIQVGYSNTAFGYNTLNATTTTNLNTAIGSNVLEKNISVGNTGLGTRALLNNTVGSYNIGLGYGALLSNVSGMRNIGLGANSLFSNTVENYNIGIGDESDIAVGVNYSTAIGYKSYVSQSNSLVLGSIGVANGTTLSTNVGIGTSAPTQKLEVKDGNILTNQNIYASSATSKVLIGNMAGLNTTDYSLAVNGTAIFTKAIVRLTNTWPDFVFEPTYNLPTLSQVEAYINKHKHLEGVPSAAEVKEKGIDLGDNQTILLKKVEELTLYMIELNKKVEVLAKENEELKKKVNGDK